MNESVLVVLSLLSYAVMPVGIIVLTIFEIYLLKKKGWVDENKSVTYPLAINGICFVTGIGLFVVNFIVGVISAYAIFFLPDSMIVQEPQSSNFLFYIVMVGIRAILCVILDFAILFPVRLLATKLILKSSALTWKYDALFAFLLAFLLGFVMQAFSMLPLITQLGSLR